MNEINHSPTDSIAHGTVYFKYMRAFFMRSTCYVEVGWGHAGKLDGRTYSMGWRGRTGMWIGRGCSLVEKRKKFAILKLVEVDKPGDDPH